MKSVVYVKTPTDPFSIVKRHLREIRDEFAQRLGLDAAAIEVTLRDVLAALAEATPR